MMSEPPRRPIQRLFREPLLHFLVLGALLFAVAEFGADAPPTGGPDTIVVTEGRIDQLVEIWMRTRLRPPTPRELKGLIDEYVREEALYRAAVEIGLDDDDTIVRRRLAQKMEFVAEGFASVGEPNDEQLKTLLEAEPERFRSGGSVSFQQVFVNRAERGDSAGTFAQSLLSQLRAGEQDASTLGDGVLLEFEHRDLSLDQVDRLFGAGFSASLESLDRSVWSGPVESGYGLHLVRVIDLEAPRVPDLAEVRQAVREEWLFRERRSVHDAFIQAIVDRHTVVIETPP